MTFNDVAKAFLSNDIICIMDNIINGKVIVHNPAYKWIDNPQYKDKEIERITIIPRNIIETNNNHSCIGVTLK